MNIHTSIYEFMRDFHKKDDHKAAVVFGNRKMRWKALFSEIERVAAGFYAMGVRKGDVVAIALPNIPQAVVAVYALARIGAIASMIHPKFAVGVGRTRSGRRSVMTKLRMKK